LEKFEYYIKDLHPSDFFNSEIDILKSLKKVYKKIKITPRGDKLLLDYQYLGIGSQQEIIAFEYS